MTPEELIKRAFTEDIPTEDITTESLSLKERFGICHLIAKQDLILSGQDLFTMAMKHIDPKLNVVWNFSDGSSILNKQIVAQIDGNMIQALKAERVALNFLGTLSGISTLTKKFVDACGSHPTKILDTRKTIPLYRNLFKKAVLDGGGMNHRMNLSDGILIKENHLAIAGTIAKAVEQARELYPEAKVEVEVKNLSEVNEAVIAKADRIMLDNMSLELMKKSLEITPESIETEASGNMSLERVPSVAALGVDFISVGALTHSAPCADFSLLFDWN